MLAIIIGLVCVVAGILWLLPPQYPGFGYAWDDAFRFIKGFLSLGLPVGGVIAVAAGISSIKDKIATKREEAKRKEEEKKEKKEEEKKE